MSEREDLPIISSPEETKLELSAGAPPTKKIEDPSKLRASPKPAPTPTPAPRPVLSLKTESSASKQAVVKAPSEIAIKRPTAPPPSGMTPPPAAAPHVETKSVPPPAPKIEPTPPIPKVPADAVADEAAELLQEFQSRQNAAMRKLETVISEHKKVVAERDALRDKNSKLEALLDEATARLTQAEKAETELKSLQQKLDAALLSNNMMSNDHSKTKTRLAELETKLLTVDDKVSATRKELDGALASLNTHMRAREEAEHRIAAALALLQGRPSK